MNKITALKEIEQIKTNLIDLYYKMYKSKSWNEYRNYYNALPNTLVQLEQIIKNNELIDISISEIIEKTKEQGYKLGRKETYGY